MSLDLLIGTDIIDLEGMIMGFANYTVPSHGCDKFKAYLDVTRDSHYDDTGTEGSPSGQMDQSSPRSVHFEPLDAKVS